MSHSPCSLRIKHNDLTRYFRDYSEFYPTGLSFELAIQVFWRPQHLTEGKQRFLHDRQACLSQKITGMTGIHGIWMMIVSMVRVAFTLTGVHRGQIHVSTTSNDALHIRKWWPLEKLDWTLDQSSVRQVIGFTFVFLFFRNECKTHVQCRAFEEQLKIAARWFKPIVIHSRDAYQETFQLMKQVDEQEASHCQPRNFLSYYSCLSAPSTWS